MGRGRARAPAAAAPAPRRPTPGPASLGRAWAGAGAANVARAESPNVTARGGWRRRRRAGEGEGAECAGRREGGGGEEKARRGDAAAARAPELGRAAAATAAQRAPSGLAGGKKQRVGVEGVAGRGHPPLSLPPSMGAGAFRPPQPSEEGQPRTGTSELRLSSPQGRARQDRCSRWPSTYQLAVRQVPDAFALVPPATDEIRAAELLHGVGTCWVGGGRRGERAPRGRRRKKRATSGYCGRFPDKCSAQKGSEKRAR